MTETQQRPDRPPVRPRSGRRPIPPLIFLLVLCLAALFVWWNVFGDEAERERSKEAACASTAAAIPSLDPSTVSVRVLNASDVSGLAGKVAKALSGRGFVIAEVGNDDGNGEVTGAGQVRYGKRGVDAARFLSLQQPDVVLVQDTRATAVVDLVLGPDFDKLASAESVTKALSAQPTEAPVGC